MTRRELATLLVYDPVKGALTWRETGENALVPTERGPRVQYGGHLFSAASLIWLITHGRIPPRVTFLNGDPSDLRMSNMRYLSEAELREHNRARKKAAAQAASARLPKGVLQCRSTGLYYARVLKAGRIVETPRVSDPEQVSALRRALLTP